MFLGDVSLFWYADDIFDLTVQDMAEVGNGVNVEIAALPQFGQRSGIDVELVDELVLCDPFLFQKLPERRVVHIVAFIRILHDFIIWRKTCFIIGIIVSMCCYGVEVMDLSSSIYDPLVINAEIFKILLEMGLFDDSGKLVPLEREFRLLHQRLYAHGCLEQKLEYYIVICAEGSARFPVSGGFY